MADWATVRELALALHGAEEARQERPEFRVRGKLFAWMSPHKQGEGALVIRIDPDEKELLLESNPAAYFTTPHYESYPGLLIRLEHIEGDELAERIEDSWLTRVPKRVAEQFLDER